MWCHGWQNRSQWGLPFHDIPPAGTAWGGTRLHGGWVCVKVPMPWRCLPACPPTFSPAYRPALLLACPPTRPAFQLPAAMHQPSAGPGHCPSLLLHSIHGSWHTLVMRACFPTLLPCPPACLPQPAAFFPAPPDADPVDAAGRRGLAAAAGGGGGGGCGLQVGELTVTGKCGASMTGWGSVPLVHAWFC